MKSRQERNLEIINGIDEQIIERNTEKRTALMQVLTLMKRRQTIKRTVIGSAAGLVAASLLFVIFIPMLMGMPWGKKIPTYKGMSVIGSGDEIIQSSKIIPKERVYLAPTDEDENNSPGKPAAPNPEKPTESLWDPNAIGDTYFAEPGEDILITVHIDNPDAFEIMSFTLNGKKFTAYMFEEGSDLEHLVLKINVGEIEGYYDYTIDAIKYIDGDKIKDVRMDGDRTITIGVAIGENVPLFEIKDHTATYDELSFNYKIYDALEFLDFESGSVIAELYMEEIDNKGYSTGVWGLYTSKTITSSEGTLNFDLLVPNHSYRLKIKATYDAKDEDGNVEHILYGDANSVFETNNPFVFEFSNEFEKEYRQKRAVDLYGSVKSLSPKCIINYCIDGDGKQHDPQSILIASESIIIGYTANGKTYTARIDLEEFTYNSIKGYYEAVSPIIENDGMYYLRIKPRNGSNFIYLPEGSFNAEYFTGSNGPEVYNSYCLFISEEGACYSIKFIGVVSIKNMNLLVSKNILIAGYVLPIDCGYWISTIRHELADPGTILIESDDPHALELFIQ